jgi:hypothetical protein
LQGGENVVCRQQVLFSIMCRNFVGAVVKSFAPPPRLDATMLRMRPSDSLSLPHHRFGVEGF